MAVKRCKNQIIGINDLVKKLSRDVTKEAITGTFNLSVTDGSTANLTMVTSDTSDFTFGVKFPYRF